jgi:hypothetical protein
VSDQAKTDYTETLSFSSSTLHTDFTTWISVRAENIKGLGPRSWLSYSARDPMKPPTALAQTFGGKTSGTHIGLAWTNPAAPSGLTTAGTIIQWQPAADYALSTASQFAA